MSIWWFWCLFSLDELTPLHNLNYFFVIIRRAILSTLQREIWSRYSSIESSSDRYFRCLNMRSDMVIQFMWKSTFDLNYCIFKCNKVAAFLWSHIEDCSKVMLNDWKRSRYNLLFGVNTLEYHDICTISNGIFTLNILLVA